MDEGCAERDGSCVFDAQVEGGGRGKDAVVCGRVGDCVADDFADFEGAGLVEEEHDGGFEEVGSVAVLMLLSCGLEVGCRSCHNAMVNR